MPKIKKNWRHKIIFFNVWAYFKISVVTDAQSKSICIKIKKCRKAMNINRKWEPGAGAEDWRPYNRAGAGVCINLIARFASNLINFDLLNFDLCLSFYQLWKLKINLKMFRFIFFTSNAISHGLKNFKK